MITNFICNFEVTGNANYRAEVGQGESAKFICSFTNEGVPIDVSEYAVDILYKPSNSAQDKYWQILGQNNLSSIAFDWYSENDLGETSYLMTIRLRKNEKEVSYPGFIKLSLFKTPGFEPPIEPPLPHEPGCVDSDVYNQEMAIIDRRLNDMKKALEAGDIDVLTQAKEYADGKEFAIDNKWKEADVVVLDSAKKYADEKDAAGKVEWIAADKVILDDAKKYSDGLLPGIYEKILVGDTKTLNDAKKHSDDNDKTTLNSAIAKVNESLQSAKAYTDQKIIDTNQKIATGDDTTLKQANKYADSIKVTVDASIASGDKKTLEDAKKYAKEYADTKQSTLKAGKGLEKNLDTFSVNDKVGMLDENEVIRGTWSRGIEGRFSAKLYYDDIYFPDMGIEPQFMFDLIFEKDGKAVDPFVVKDAVLRDVPEITADHMEWYYGKTEADAKGWYWLTRFNPSGYKDESYTYAVTREGDSITITLDLFAYDGNDFVKGGYIRLATTLTKNGDTIDVVSKPAEAYITENGVDVKAGYIDAEPKIIVKDIMYKPEFLSEIATKDDITQIAKTKQDNLTFNVNYFSVDKTNNYVSITDNVATVQYVDMKPEKENQFNTWKDNTMVIIGKGAGGSASDPKSIAIGNNAKLKQSQGGIAIGPGAVLEFPNANGTGIQIGTGTNKIPNSVQFGNTTLLLENKNGYYRLGNIVRSLQYGGMKDYANGVKCTIYVNSIYDLYNSSQIEFPVDLNLVFDGLYVGDINEKKSSRSILIIDNNGRATTNLKFNNDVVQIYLNDPDALSIAPGKKYIYDIDVISLTSYQYILNIKRCEVFSGEIPRIDETAITKVEGNK